MAHRGKSVQCVQCMLVMVVCRFQNMGLRQEVELLKKENHILREKLSKFADV